jgi:hypothetical protein
LTPDFHTCPGNPASVPLNELTSVNGSGRIVGLRIPMMSISHSDLMSIRSERSDAELSQCEIVIDIRQEFDWFSLS